MNRTSTKGKRNTTETAGERRSTRTAETSRDRRKLFSSAETVLVGKDMRAIWSRPLHRAILTLLPMTLVLFLPIVYYVAISLLPKEGGMPETLRAMLGAEQLTFRPFWTQVFLSLLCPMLYLMVPVVCGVATAAGAFVGEKENGTLASLFLTSMQAKSIFNAKVTACTLISAFISLLSFVIFAITATIIDLLVGAPFFLNLEWIVSVLLLMPVLVFFSVVFVSLVLPRVFSVAETLKTIGYLVLPILLLYILQFVGVLRVSAILLAVLALVLGVLSVLLFNLSSRKFRADELLEAAET